MRCFIHTSVEAIAACRRCGKGMCENCSAYSGHSGICPECRRDDFIKEAAEKRKQIADLEHKVTWNIVKTVFLFWTLVFLFIGIYRHSKFKKEISALQERVAVLDGEINRLGEFIKTHGKQFV